MKEEQNWQVFFKMPQGTLCCMVKTPIEKKTKQNPQSYLPLRASTFQQWGGKNSPLTGRNNMGILALYSLPFLYSIITREFSLRDSLWKSYTIWILDIGKLKWYLLGLLAILILICGNIEVKVSKCYFTSTSVVWPRQHFIYSLFMNLKSGDLHNNTWMVEIYIYKKCPFDYYIYFCKFQTQYIKMVFRVFVHEIKLSSLW